MSLTTVELKSLLKRLISGKISRKEYDEAVRNGKSDFQRLRDDCISVFKDHL